MSKAATGGAGVIRVPKASPVLLGALLLGSCGPGQDPVGTPVTWWHQLQGGAIAEQRPPPPGVDAPYPLVGTTPPRPSVTSAAVRDALTASLIDQQAASHQLDTRDPIIVTAPPPPSKPKSQPQSRSSATPTPSSMATLDAAGMAQPAAPGASAPAPTPPKPPPTPAQQEAGEPILAMPPPPPGSTVIVASGPLPEMPAHPPAPPSFPGFDVPATPLPPVHPNLENRPAQLANVEFQPGSDVLLPTARAALQHVASSRGAAPVKVDGYGDAQSDRPDAQAAALRLGLARAAAAAAALEQLGVPQASIEVAASAFGRGASVTVVH